MSMYYWMVASDNVKLNQSQGTTTSAAATAIRKSQTQILSNRDKKLYSWSNTVQKCKFRRKLKWLNIKYCNLFIIPHASAWPSTRTLYVYTWRPKWIQKKTAIAPWKNDEDVIRNKKNGRREKGEEGISIGNGINLLKNSLAKMENAKSKIVSSAQNRK